MYKTINKKNISYSTYNIIAILINYILFIKSGIKYNVISLLLFFKDSSCGMKKMHSLLLKMIIISIVMAVFYYLNSKYIFVIYTSLVVKYNFKS